MQMLGIAPAAMVAMKVLPEAEVPKSEAVKEVVYEEWSVSTGMPLPSPMVFRGFKK